jgi:hypothetical protein
LPYGILARKIRLELRVHRRHLAQKIVILRDLVKPRLLAELEHAQRIVIGPIPELRVEVAEKRARLGLPRPPQIEDHGPEWFERGGQSRNDVEGMNRLHFFPDGNDWFPGARSGIGAAGNSARKLAKGKVETRKQLRP